MARLIGLELMLGIRSLCSAQALDFFDDGQLRFVVRGRR